MQENLKQFSDAQLKEELARRTEEKKSDIPKPLDNIDWVPLINYLQHGIQTVDEENREPKDFEHWIFETAMETVYGPDVWKWWNSKL